MLRVQPKIPLEKDEMAKPQDRTVPVKKGARQGAIASPCYFNNYVLEAQDQCQMSCVLSGHNISLVIYADDIFNLSRTLDKIPQAFQKLQTEYLKSGLEFNAETTDVVLFNWKGPLPDEIVLENSKIRPSDQIVYLVIPIGNAISHTRHLLTEHIKRRISASYASIVSAKLCFNRRYLSTLYNTVALPHILYIAPFWKVLTHVDKLKIRSTFFRFAKYLLRYPIWTRNSKLINRLHIADPTIAVVKLIEKHNQKISNYAWKQLLLH
jgi:hypothetical protein